jgi:hypothetical protein
MFGCQSFTPEEIDHGKSEIGERLAAAFFAELEHKFL